MRGCRVGESRRREKRKMERKREEENGEKKRENE